LAFIGLPLLLFLLVHRQHALGDQEAAKNIHACEDQRDEAEATRQSTAAADHIDTDRKQRAELAAAKATGPDAGISGPVALENAWVKQITTMTTPELAAYFGQFDVSRQNDPVVKAKLTFIEGEVANRIRRAEEEHAKKPQK
jgi:hypothetical protein